MHHKNPSLDYEEIWDGSILLQLDDHLNDDDDIVPELNDTPKIKKKVDPGALVEKKDFAGDSYEEVFDE